jgi:hypothetical protein
MFFTNYFGQKVVTHTFMTQLFSPRIPFRAPHSRALDGLFTYQNDGDCYYTPCIIDSHFMTAPRLSQLFFGFVSHPLSDKYTRPEYFHSLHTAAHIEHTGSYDDDDDDVLVSSFSLNSD